MNIVLPVVDPVLFDRRGKKVSGTGTRVTLRQGEVTYEAVAGLAVTRFRPFLFEA
jgi:hypothetical protein